MFDASEQVTSRIDGAVRAAIEASEWLDIEFGGAEDTVWVGRWRLPLPEVQRVLGNTTPVTPYGLADIANKLVRVVRVDARTGRREVAWEATPGDLAR